MNYSTQCAFFVFGNNLPGERNVTQILKNSQMMKLFILAYNKNPFKRKSGDLNSLMMKLMTGTHDVFCSICYIVMFYIGKQKSRIKLSTTVQKIYIIKLCRWSIHSTRLS